MTLKDLNQESDKESPNKYTDEMELNEKHLSLIYDSLSDVVFLLAVEPDDCFRFISVNQAFLDVTGLTREQVVGKRIEQVLPETAHALVISKYKEAINDNKTVFWEQASTFPTGELVGAVAVTPVRTAGGVCTHLVGSVHDLTEIRRAEKIMQESEEKYKALYDNAPLSYQSLNEDGNFNDVNPAWLRTLGYDRKEVIGKWFGDFLHPDWKPHFEKNFQEFKRRGYVHDVQFKIKHKDGHYLDISFEGYIGYNPDGSFKQTYCVFQDITERKQAEEALRDSRYMLQTVLDSIPAGVFWKDRDSIYLGGNRTWLEKAGLKSSEEVVGKSDYDFPWDKKQADSYREDDRTVIESGIPKYDIIEPYLQADGTHAWAKTNKVPLRDTEGNVIGVLGTYEDITERKQAEKMLQRSESLLNATQQLSKVGGWEWDVEEQTMFWSDEVYRIHDFQPSEFTTGSMEHIEQSIECYDPEDRPVIMEAFRNCAEKGKAYDIEFPFTTALGRRIWIRTVANPVLKDEKVVKITGNIIDITKRKKAEIALRESEEQFRTMFEQSPLAIHIYTPDGCPVEANSALMKLWGFDEKTYQVIKENWNIFKDEQAITLGYVPLIKQAFNGTEVTLPEMIFDSQKALSGLGVDEKNTLKRWIQPHYYPVKNDQGEVFLVVAMIENITERKQAMEALHESEERLSSFMNSASDSFYLLDADLNFVEINERGLSIIGKNREDVIGKNITEIVPDVKESGRYEQHLEVIRTGQPFVIDHFIPHPVFGDLNFMLKSFKVGDGLGVIATDITERKHAEEALRQSEQDLRLRNQINNIFLTYPDEEIYAEILELIRKAMESKYGTFGYFDENGSFIALAVTRKIYWDKCNVPEKNIIFEKGTFGGIWGRAIKERKTLISNDCPFNTPKGHIPIENTMVTPIIFHDEVISAIHIANKPNGYDEKDRAVLETIADQIAPVLYARLQRDRKDMQRKQAEEEIRLHAAMMDNVAEGIYLVGLDDLIIKWTNEIFERMFGYDPGEMVGKQVDIINAPTEKTPTETRISIVDVLKETGEWHGEVRSIKRDGTHFWCYANVSLFDHPGYGKVIVSVHTDITERKQAEKALWERIKELKCLYNIAEISNRPEIALDELFQESVSLLPPGWQYPEIIGSRITVDGKVYSTKNFKETKWMQREDIHTTNEIVGTVEVCYLKEKPDENEGPFLEEERKLIENIARQLGEHITRKQAEEALQRSEALLNATQQLSKVGGWEWDVEKQTMFWSDEVYRIHDFQPSEFTSGSMEHIEQSIECYDPEDRPVIMEAFRNCAEKGKAYDIEFPFTTALGRRIWIRTVANPVLKDEKVVKITGNIIDITERKQAEEELHKRMNELETFYRTTLGREERVIEVKQEVNELLEQLGKNKKYRDYSKE